MLAGKAQVLKALCFPLLMAQLLAGSIKSRRAILDLMLLLEKEVNTAEKGFLTTQPSLENVLLL